MMLGGKLLYPGQAPTIGSWSCGTLSPQECTSRLSQNSSSLLLTAAVGHLFLFLLVMLPGAG